MSAQSAGSATSGSTTYVDRLVQDLMFRRQVALSHLRRRDYGPKVFCIGYNKTGTTSVGHALAELGYRHTSFNRVVWTLYGRGQVNRIIDYMSRFESADDLPWLKEDVIPILDARFPGSKFIYLTREERSWRRSIARWTRWMTGKSLNVNVEWERFVAHRQFVTTYFAARPNDLLTLDVADPDGFDRLAAFLGKQAPRAALPKVNVTPNTSLSNSSRA